VYAGLGLVACTYGLVRLAYGLFLPDVQASLALGSAAAGYVSSGASLAYCVGAAFGLAAATRSRQLVLGALLTAGVGSAGMAAAPDLLVFVPSAIVGSMGAGLASPALVAMVQRNIRASDGDRAQAVVNSGTGPGLVAAGLLALVLLPEWRVGFAISGVLTAVIGISVLLLDRSATTHGTTLEDGPAQPRGRAWGWVSALVRPAAAAALLGAASAVVWTYGRTQLVDQGATETASLLAWIALGVGGAATVLTSRVLSALPPTRAWLLTVASVAVAIATLGVAADVLVLAVAGCAVFGWGFVAGTSGLIAWTQQVVPDRTAAGSSLLFITLVLGQAAGSAAAGWITEVRGLSTAFLVAAATAVVAASLGLWRARRTPKDGRDVSPAARAGGARPAAAAPGQDCPSPDPGSPPPGRAA
jgi:predicted MFS family arabinose efflux permease